MKINSYYIIINITDPRMFHELGSIALYKLTVHRRVTSYCVSKYNEA
ncbi:hypothetical protein OIU76_026179 [Salix suchowensis]|nr:hypothetical protein OIU76_026179 [Salix suchowensis]